MTPAEKRQRTILRKRGIHLRRLCCQPCPSKCSVDALVVFEVKYGDKLRELEDKFDALEDA